jgi:hypothetical protein
LRVTKEAYSSIYKGWDYEKIIINQDFETLCKAQNHRPPAYFPFLPWERAYNYIKKFPSHPPKK